MIASTGTTATDIYTELCATIDMGLVEDFNKAFDANWKTDDLEGVASDAAFSFVNDMPGTETIRFLRNGINEGDPATLDALSNAFAEFNANRYFSSTTFMQDVGSCYLYNKTLDQYINNLTTFALIAAASWVEDEYGQDCALCANSIERAMIMAERGNATPKAITDAFLGRR